MKKTVPILGLLAFGAAAGLLALEIMLRLAGISYPNFYDYDHDRGGALRPGAKGWWRQEGKAYIEINRAGERDRDHVEAKPPGTLRIAVLGDSYAEAFQVPLEETFWSVLGGELKKCGALRGRDVEVLNFGVSGYGTAQEWITLKTRAWRYSPDIVLLAFVAGNDIRNNSKELDSDDVRPFYLYQDGRLVLDDSFKELPRYRQGTTGLRPVLGRWRNRLRVLQVIYRLKGILKAKREMREEKASAGDRPPHEAGLAAEVYSPPKDQVWKRSWDATEGMLSEMNREVVARGSEFWVMLVTEGVQVHPDASVRKKALDTLHMEDLYYPNRRIRELAGRSGFHVVDLAPPFVEYAETNNAFLHGFPDKELGSGHWNVLGHRLAGEEISRRICEKRQELRPQ